VRCTQLRVAGLISAGINEHFESIFEVGVDEMSWDDLSKNDAEWPSVRAVNEYRRQAFALVKRAIITHPALERLPVTQLNPAWALFMALEHEKIHIVRAPAAQFCGFGLSPSPHALRGCRAPRAWAREERDGESVWERCGSAAARTLGHEHKHEHERAEHEDYQPQDRHSSRGRLVAVESWAPSASPSFAGWWPPDTHMRCR
jgi:hypothetical protein